MTDSRYLELPSTGDKPKIDKCKNYDYDGIETISLGITIILKSESDKDTGLRKCISDATRASLEYEDKNHSELTNIFINLVSEYYDNAEDIIRAFKFELGRFIKDSRKDGFSKILHDDKICSIKIVGNRGGSWPI